MYCDTTGKKIVQEPNRTYTCDLQAAKALPFKDKNHYGNSE